MSDKYKKIGDALAAARRARNKSLQEASDGTRIMIKYLEAIENGQASALPSAPYFLLFARSYAQYLGIDQAIIDDIENVDRNGGPAAAESASNETIISLSPVVRRGHRRLILGLIIGVSVCLLVILGYYFKWYALFSRGSDTSAVIASSPTDHSVSRSANDINANLNISYKPYEPPAKLTLNLKTNQEVWATVIKDGDTVLNRQLAAGDTGQWQADYRFQLSLGNTAAVALTLNGAPLAPLTARGPAVTALEINQANYRQFLLPDSTAQSPIGWNSAAVRPPDGMGGSGGN